MSFVTELWLFLPERKKIWLFSVLLGLVLFGVLLVVAERSVIAPFIYALF